MVNIEYIKLFKRTSMLLLFVLSVVTNTGKAATSTEEYMRGFISDLNNHDITAFKKRLDLDAFVNRVYSGGVLDTKYKHRYKQGMVDGMDNASKLLVTLMPAHGYAKLIRIKKGNTFDKALVRFDLGDNGYSFRDLYIDKSTKKIQRIIDWYDYTYGQKFSDYNRQFLALGSPDVSVITKILNITRNRKKDVDGLLQLIKTLETKNKEQALKIYMGFDSSFRKIRSVILMSYSIASRIGSSELYRITLSDLGKYHGNEASLNFVLIDHYIFEKQYDKALSAINKFMKEIGGNDAALLGLKANIHVVKEDCRTAIKVSKIALDTENNFEEPHWTLLDCYVSEKQYNNAVKVMNKIENTFNMVFNVDILKEDPSYLAFMETETFKKWYAQSLSKKDALQSQ